MNIIILNMTDHIYSFDQGDSDPVFGIRLVEGGEWYLGNKPITFMNGYIELGDVKIKETSGLRELLFKKLPIKYSKQDLNSYKLMLVLSNAHKRKFIFSKPINANKSYKYQRIISKLFPPKRKRELKLNLLPQKEGIKVVNDSPIKQTLLSPVEDTVELIDSSLKRPLLPHDEEVYEYFDTSEVIARMKFLHHIGRSSVDDKEFQLCVLELRKRKIIE